MNTPLVSIVVLSYNHASYIEECLSSVFNQAYSNFEVIVVDDCSNDDSQLKIASYLEKNAIKTSCIFNDTNIGNCKSFNKGLKLAQGTYVIDLAADDMLMPDAINSKTRFFESKPDECVMVYSEAEHIDENSNSIGIYSQIKNSSNFPSGHIFTDILARHFICPPTVMFKTATLNQIGGYDETLAYEDFDVWLRLSKLGTVEYQNEVTVQKRISKTSFSNQFTGARKKELLKSTLFICQRVEKELETDSEKEALVQRVKFELRFAMRQGQKEIVSEYLKILKRLGEVSFVHRILSCFY